MNRIADARQAWVVTVLLSLFMMVNFANKAVFGLSAVPIMHELHLSHSVFGLLGSAFFMLFSPSAILVGFVANRLSSSCLLFAMALLWSACQLPVVWSASVSSLLLSRIVLGFAEGPAYPVALHAVLKCFAKARQALPVSIIANGASVGTGLIAPTIVLVIERWSWHVAFGFVGIAGLVWCAAWILFGREGAPTGATPEPAQNTGLPYRQLLLCRTVIGAAVMQFSAYWLVTLGVVWLPAFLHESSGYSAVTVSWTVAIISTCHITIVPAISAMSDGRKNCGVATRRARVHVASGCVALAGIATILLSKLSGPVLPVVCSAVAFSAGNVAFVLGPVVLAEITPLHQRGAVFGTLNSCATLAGPLAPHAMGLLADVDTTTGHGLRAGFCIVGCFVVVGASIGFAAMKPEADLARFALSRAAGRPGGAGV